MSDKQQAYFSALQDNDENAFETLFLRHYAGLVNFVKVFMPDAQEEARDIVADVFGYLWTNRKPIKGEDSPVPAPRRSAFVKVSKEKEDD